MEEWIRVTKTWPFFCSVLFYKRRSNKLTLIVFCLKDRKSKCKKNHMSLLALIFYFWIFPCSSTKLCQMAQIHTTIIKQTFYLFYAKTQGYISFLTLSLTCWEKNTQERAMLTTFTADQTSENGLTLASEGNFEMSNNPFFSRDIRKCPKFYSRAPFMMSNDLILTIPNTHLFVRTAENGEIVASEHHFEMEEDPFLSRCLKMTRF